ncbi:MFS transporter [Aspergillus flavus]|nr:MFS transporter [Aspergillus flavus]
MSRYAYPVNAAEAWIRSSKVRVVSTLTGLPFRQLALLAICHFAETVVLTSIVPYMPDMLEHAGVPKSDVAKWVGFTTTITATCAGLMGVIWGMASDSMGRKRVILLELNLMLVFVFLFGFSQHLTLLVLFRALIGLVSGSVGIMRTMIAELVPEKLLQPYAFSILPTVETIGSGFGPAIGGLLARPAEHYPGIFGRIGLFKMFPFALSSVASSCVVAFAITMASSSLRETQPGRKDSPDDGLMIGKILSSVWALRKRKADIRPEVVDETTALLGDTIEDVEEVLEQRAAELVGRWKSVISPQPILLVLISGVMSMHTVAFDSLFPVLLHLPKQHLKGNPDVHLPFKFSSGLGLETNEMGLFYSIVGVSSMVFQLVIFPWAARKYGILQCLKLACTVFPIMYLVVPFVPLLPQPLSSVAVVALLVLKMAGAAFVFPCCTILISEVAGAIGMLATVNGIATSIIAFGQALGPGVMGPTFSFGVKLGYTILPWWLLAGFAFLSSLPVAWIKEVDIKLPEEGLLPNEEEQQVGDGENDMEARGRQPTLI